MLLKHEKGDSKMDENSIFKVIYFDDLMPRIQLVLKVSDIDYHKAFLDRDEKQTSDFSWNTTTWD